MKKIFTVVFAAMIFLTGCDDDKIIVATTDLPQSESILEKIKDYYGGKEVVTKELDYISANDRGCDVFIDEIKSDDNLGYGMHKSVPLFEKYACAISYGEYKMTSDFSGKKAGYLKDFDYSHFLPENTDCEFSVYEDEAVMISDLKEGVIDLVVCDNITAGKYLKDGFRVNELIDTNNYGLYVYARDMKLIDSINSAVGE